MSLNATPQMVGKVLAVMKESRAGWVSAKQLAAAIDGKPETAKKWADEMAAQGFLIDSKGPKPPKGPVPRVYRLAPEWGGPKQ